jgi:very-short-patch-repair endonuclease
LSQAGVLTSAQAVALVGRGVVRGRVRLAMWRSVCRGIVVTHNGQLTREQQLWVAVLAAGEGAVLAGKAAATEGGVRGLRAERLDVLVPAARRSSVRLQRLPPDMPGVRVHRTAILPAAHRQIGRPPRTSTARSVVDAAAWASTAGEAQLVLAMACQQRRVLAGEVAEVLAVLPTVRRRRLMLTTLTDIEGGAEALSEINFASLCRRYRLPQPDRQVHRTDFAGRRRYLDACWRAYRLHVEIDGAHHMDARQWAADMLRQNEVWIAGDRILRFPAWLIRADPAAVANQLRAALAAAGASSLAGAGPSPLAGAGPSPLAGAGPSPLAGAGPSPLAGAGPSPLAGAGPSPLAGAGPSPLTTAGLRPVRDGPSPAGLAVGSGSGL